MAVDIISRQNPSEAFQAVECNALKRILYGREGETPQLKRRDGTVRDGLGERESVMKIGLS